MPISHADPVGGGILSGLDEAMHGQILRTGVNRRYRRGQVMLRRGDTGSGMVIVTTGRVRVGVTSADGRELVLGILGPGDVLGEMALLDGEARSADAVALEDVTAVVLERARFLRLLQETPELSLRLLAVLTARLRRANAAIEDIALLSLEGRLARLLQRLAQEYGRPGADGVRIELRLTQKDLSALVGGSREKVNRRLRQWEAAGAIGKQQGYVVLRRPELLAALARPAVDPDA